MLRIIVGASPGHYVRTSANGDIVVVFNGRDQVVALIRRNLRDSSKRWFTTFAPGYEWVSTGSHYTLRVNGDVITVS